MLLTKGDAEIASPTTAAPAAVTFDAVSKRYGKVVAVDDVTFHVARGELLTLLGPSGSGKSTLLSMAAGATIPDQGELLFSGRVVTRLPPHLRNIGMVFQRYTLFPNKTVAENIAFPLAVRKQSRESIGTKVVRALEMVGLTTQADRYPSEISGGQAQRVALARALVFGPDLMLMDEPLGALDKSLRGNLQDEIRRIQQQTGVPTLFVTHDQEEAMNISDRIIMLNHGRIVADGAPKDLYERPPSLWVAQFLGEANVFPVVSWEADDTLARCRQADGRIFYSRRNGTLKPGSMAAVVLRPEDCIVSKAAGEDQHSMTGVIAKATYLGARLRLVIILDSGGEVIASARGRMDVGNVGDRVFVSAERDSAFLVSADE